MPLLPARPPHPPHNETLPVPPAAKAPSAWSGGAYAGWFPIR